MASTTSTSNPFSFSSSSTVIETKIRQSAVAVSLPTLPHSQNRAGRTTTTYRRKLARNVVAMATGEATTTTTELPPVVVAATEDTTTELPEIVKTLQETWDKVEDKYAVSSLAIAGIVGLWGTTGLISAIDKLPLVPGALELVGIGYTVWFTYKNLVFKPDREALIQKVKDTYKDILGTS